MTLRTLNYGNYGIFLIMGHAGFCPSTVLQNKAKGFLQPVFVPIKADIVLFVAMAGRVIKLLHHIGA